MSSPRWPPDIAVLIIEHDMDLVFRFAERITVLVQGASVHAGHARTRSPNNEQVRAGLSRSGSHRGGRHG